MELVNLVHMVLGVTFCFPQNFAELNLYGTHFPLLHKKSLSLITEIERHKKNLLIIDGLIILKLLSAPCKIRNGN